MTTPTTPAGTRWAEGIAYLTRGTFPEDATPVAPVILAVKSAERERLRLAYIEMAHGSGISGRAFLSVLAIFRTPGATP